MDPHQILLFKCVERHISMVIIWSMESILSMLCLLSRFQLHMVLDERNSRELKKELGRMLSVLLEEKLQEIMYTCIILHNMIIEDEGRAICAFDEEEIIPETQPIEIGGEKYINRRAEIRCTETFHNLRNDLVEHIYGVQNINLNLDPPDDPEDEFSENDFM